VINNWAGIFHEIGYNASIHDNVVSGNSTSNPAQGQGPCGFMWCSDIQISSAGGTGTGIVDIFNNTITPNFGGQTNGKAIGLIQQNRGNGNLGPYLTRNVHVHDNTINLSIGNARSGAVQDIGSNAVFTSQGNTFVHDNYTLDNPGTTPFNWNNTVGNQAFWQGFGLDTTGTFTYLNPGGTTPVITAVASPKNFSTPGTAGATLVTFNATNTTAATTWQITGGTAGDFAIPNGVTGLLSLTTSGANSARWNGTPNQQSAVLTITATNGTSVSAPVNVTMTGYDDGFPNACQ